MGLVEVLDRVTMQVFVRGDCTMIAAPVQCDVDGVPKGLHFRKSTVDAVHPPSTGSPNPRHITRWSARTCDTAVIRRSTQHQASRKDRIQKVIGGPGF